MLDLGLGGNAATKSVPEWVFSSNIECIRGFVSGYYDADGTKKEFEFVSNSEELAKGMVELFNLLGLFPNLPVKKGRAFRVTMHGVDYRGVIQSKFGKLEEYSGSQYQRKIPFFSFLKEEVKRLYKLKGPLNREWRKSHKREMGIVDGPKEFLGKRSWESFREAFKGRSFIDRLYEEYVWLS